MVTRSWLCFCSSYEAAGGDRAPSLTMPAHDRFDLMDSGAAVEMSVEGMQRHYWRIAVIPDRDEDG